MKTLLVAIKPNTSAGICGTKTTSMAACVTSFWNGSSNNRNSTCHSIEYAEASGTSCSV